MMKKIYFFLMAMLVGLVAGAADYSNYYLNVPGSFNNWGDNGVKMTSDGVATVKLTGISSGAKFKIKVWNGNSPEWYSNGETIAADKDYVISGNTGDMKFGSDLSGTVYVTFNYATKTMRASTTDPNAALPFTYQLHGSFNSSDWTNVDLVNTSGTTWTANDVEVTYESAAFGIREMQGTTQTKWYNATQATTVNGDITVDLAVNGGKNLSIAPGKYSFSFDTSNGRLVITGTSTGGVVQPEEKEYTVYYDNGKTAWETVYAYVWDAGGQMVAEWPGTEMTKGEGTVWTYTFKTALVPANIIFNDGTGNDANKTGDLVFENGKTYGEAAGGGDEQPEKKEYTVYYDNGKTAWTTVYAYVWDADGQWVAEWPGTEMTKGEGTVWTYTFETTLVPANIIFNDGTGNDANKTGDLVFENGKTYGEAAGDPEEWKALYLVGLKRNWESVDEAYKMSTENGVTYTITLEEGIPAGTEWKIWDGTWSYNFGCGAEQPLTTGAEYQTWFNGGNFTVTTSSKTVITLTIIEGSDVLNSNIPSILTIQASSSGIEGIEADADADAMYFNMQGVRVNNPAHGMYIMVRGNKASKVLVK